MPNSLDSVSNILSPPPVLLLVGLIIPSLLLYLSVERAGLPQDATKKGLWSLDLFFPLPLMKY